MSILGRDMQTHPRSIEATIRPRCCVTPHAYTGQSHANMQTEIVTGRPDLLRSSLRPRADTAFRRPQQFTLCPGLAEQTLRARSNVGFHIIFIDTVWRSLLLRN